MQSLAVRLTLAFLVVGVVAVGLVGLLIRWGSEGEIDRFVYDRDVVSFATLLGNQYATAGSWSGVESLFQRSRGPNSPVDWRHVSVALVDSDRRVIYGQGEFTAGQTLSASSVQGALAIEANGKTVARLLVRRPTSRDARTPDSPETLLLQRLGRIILLSALGAVVLALVVGALLARSLTHPIRDLTEATSAIANGKLGAQVAVRSHDEMGQLASSFNRMSSDLARSTEMRRQMTADVAHDLRTPLSLLLGYTEALHDGKFRGSQQTYAVMHDAAQQLQHLVEDLNTLALADAGELKLMRQPVAPQALLERTVRAFAARAQAQQVALAVESGSDAPLVDVDPDRIFQVLANLVANALRYTPAGGKVSLSARPQDAGVAMCVQDTGSGIAPEHLPYVFDRFYRADQARHGQSGEAGLGLAIARSIVESHGGTISVQSTPGQGAAFTIWLPAAGN